MGAFDAAAYCDPVLTSDWGGFREYLDPELLSLVRGSLAPVENMHPSFSPDQRWFEPDVAHGAALLRAVFDHHDSARGRALELQENVL